MIQRAHHNVAKVFHCRLTNLQDTTSTRRTELSVQLVPLPLSASCIVGFFELEVYEKEEIGTLVVRPNVVPKSFCSELSAITKGGLQQKTYLTILAVI